jgi:hypothetical protein
VILIINGTLWCWGRTGFAPFITGKNNKQQTTSEEQMKFNKWTLGLDSAREKIKSANAVRFSDIEIGFVS